MEVDAVAHRDVGAGLLVGRRVDSGVRSFLSGDGRGEEREE